MSTVTAPLTRTPALRGAADLAGRTLLALLFVISGLGKLAAYAGTAGYMESVGVPGALLPLVIALEVLGGLAHLAHVDLGQGRQRGGGRGGWRSGRGGGCGLGGGRRGLRQRQHRRR